MSNNMLLSVCVRVTLAKDQIQSRIIKSLVAFASTSPLLAHADGSDVAGMVTSVATGGVTVTQGALKLAQMLGVIAVIGALIAAKQRKDNPQIKISHIGGALVFGVCLIAVPEIIKRSQSQIGLTPINVG